MGYNPDHLPYSFFNQQNRLVGLDVELMHRLAARLEVRLEFIPFSPNTVVEQLNAGEIDVAVGGLMMKPERLLRVGFTQPYQKATLAIVVPDHRRRDFSRMGPIHSYQLLPGWAWFTKIWPRRRQTTIAPNCKYGSSIRRAHILRRKSMASMASFWPPRKARPGTCCIRSIRS